MTKYAPEQFRKILKSEQAEHIEQAIEIARTAPAQYEGSVNPTGSTEFYHRTVHESLEHYADLKANGWTLEHTAPAFYNKLYSFVAVKPDHVFEADKALIAQRAEQAYIKQVEDHNKEAQRLKDKATFVESEFQRLEAERLAALRAELENQYENRGRIQRVNSTDVKLHA
ncbi:hypothetical protein [Pseudomonas sp. LB3P38]|uniref:hypothetical protein n=1 Tax=Pseudomonas lyxosi TaxID=3398358 RepID=UPI0039EE4FA4